MIAKLMRKLFPERIVSVRFVAEWEIDALEYVNNGIVSGSLPRGKWILHRVDDRHFSAEWKRIGKRQKSVIILYNEVHPVYP